MITCAKRGFTLIELTMSIVIVSILLLALGSTLSLTLYATNTAASAAKKNERTAEVADQLTADLSVARDFTERTATAVTFTVPDRDGDGAADLLRYARSGNLLTRQYQANAAATIAQDVQLFNLSYATRAQPLVQSSDSILASFDNAAIGGTQDTKIKDDEWACQYFTPTLPAGTTSWSISRIRLLMKRGGGSSSGVMQVQVRLPAANKSPSLTVLDQSLVFELALIDNYSWIDVPFKNLQTLSPSQPLCIVIKAFYDDDLAEVLRQDWNASIQAGSWYTEYDSGWGTPTNQKCLRFYVYGKAQ